MKKVSVLLLALLLLLVGCGTEGVAQAEYDELQAEYDELQEKYDELKETCVELEETCDELEEMRDYHERREKIASSRLIAHEYMLDAIFYDTVMGVGFDYKAEIEARVSQYDLDEEEEELFLEELEKLLDFYQGLV